MANLNGDIKKWKRGELAGTVATVFCGIVLVCFIICYPLSIAKELKTLQLVSLITAPVLLVAGAGVSAFCNLKFGGALEKAVRQYVLDVFVENAAQMHPERNSLTFYITPTDVGAELTVNGYKDIIAFDFSALGKLSYMRKAAILTEIQNRLCVTYIRLLKRGSKYSEVSYCVKKKSAFIIKDGQPDKKAYKTYVNNNPPA